MNHRNNIYRTYSKNPQVVQLVILGKLINEYLWICLCTAVEMEWSQMSHSRVLRVHFHCHSKYVVEMKCATQNDQINRSRLVRPNYSKSNSSWWSWYDRCCLITKRLNKEELNNKVVFSCPVHGSVAWELCWVCSCENIFFIGSDSVNSSIRSYSCQSLQHENISCLPHHHLFWHLPTFPQRTVPLCLLCGLYIFLKTQKTKKN